MNAKLLMRRMMVGGPILPIWHLELVAMSTSIERLQNECLVNQPLPYAC